MRRTSPDRAVLAGPLSGDRVWVAIRAEDVRVHAGELAPDVNYVPVQLMRLRSARAHVRLEFAGGISADISHEQFARQKDNKGGRWSFRRQALRVF